MTAVGAKTEGTVGALGRSQAIIRIFLLIREVLLDDIVCLHVDLLVGVGLALVDLLHASALLNKQGISVYSVGDITSSLLIQVADLQDVLKAVESDLYDLVVRADQEIAQRLDAALSNQIADLIRLLETAAGGIADSPASLLASLQVAVGEQVNQGRDDVGIDDSLDLGGVSSRYVGNRPACLLANAILVRTQKGE